MNKIIHKEDSVSLTLHNRQLLLDVR